MRKASLIGDSEARRLALRRQKLLATSLLIIAELILVGARLLPEPTYATRLMTAAAEAAIIGGLADWFAVTALFRRPLGLPIPHTALVPTRKNDIGRSLGSFVRDQFLDPELLIERMRGKNLAEQLARWLNTATTAHFIAERIVSMVPIALSAANDAEIRGFVRNIAHAGLRRLDLVPTVDAAIGTLVRTGKHMEIIDALIEVLRPSLQTLKKPIVERVGERTGRFFPAYFDRKIGEGIIEGVEKWLDAVRTPGTDERVRLDVRIQKGIDHFRASSDYPKLLGQAQSAIVNHPALLHSLGAIWDEIKRELAEDALAPAPKMAVVSVEIVRTIGRLLDESSTMQEYVNSVIERILVDYITPWRVEIGNYIAEVVANWDGRRVASTIELQIGKELQYIRINGTLVGALIGGALFLLGTALPGFLKIAAAVEF